MKGNSLPPGCIVRGMVFPEPVKVVMTQPIGGKLKIGGQGLRTKQYMERLLNQAQVDSLSVKDLASRLGLNLQFVAGFLTTLEERGAVYHRQVGPAQIYFLGRQTPVRNNDAKNNKTPEGISWL